MPETRGIVLYGGTACGVPPYAGCFAYEVAKEHGCPLLFLGNDFAGTEIEGVL